MAMHEMNYLLLFIAGIAIGTVFFATLRWQVRLLLEKKTMLKFSLITLARFGFLTGTVYLLLKYGGWQGGILALAGIITVRFLMVQRSKKIEELRD
jgi:F1F0 ATPase subunit 2